MEHLNTVNCIHSIIQAAIRQYRGVSTKYINRYTSLFVFFRKFQGMDQNEITEQVIKLINPFSHVIRRKFISNYEIFI